MKKTQAGFTTVELIVTVVVGAVTLLVGGGLLFVVGHFVVKFW